MERAKLKLVAMELQGKVWAADGEEKLKLMIELEKAIKAMRDCKN